MRSLSISCLLAVTLFGPIACSVPSTNAESIGAMHPPITRFSPPKQSVGDTVTVHFTGFFARGDYKIYAMHGPPVIQIAANPVSPDVPRTPIVEIASFSVTTPGMTEIQTSFVIERVMGTDQYGSEFTVSNPVDLSILLHGQSQGTKVTFGWPINEGYRYQ